MNYKALELKLRTIVERVIHKGYVVRPWRTGCGDGGICLLEAVAIEMFGGSEWCFLYKPNPLYDGIDHRQLEAGFEGWTHPVDHMPGVDIHCPEYAIGARIRRDYCEWTNE